LEKTKEVSLENVFRLLQVYKRYVAGHSLLAFETFVIVAARGPLGPTEIARTMGVQQAVLTGTLDSLGECRRASTHSAASPDLVSRVEHPADARIKLAALTPKGSQLVAEMRNALGRV
jgi:DNA-binding MarR family transcriptional regulator